jgi:hypothetical protein
MFQNDTEYSIAEMEMPEYESLIPMEPLAAEETSENLTDETLAESAGGGKWREESFELDPYAPIRSALSPEHENLSADELTVVLGRRPATLLLNQLLNSPVTQQVTLATLLGRGARSSVRVNGSDISVPGYLRVLSRLSREVAEEHDVPKAPSTASHPRGIEKYSDDPSRQSYYAAFKVAIQGVAGKAKLSAKQKASLTDAIADACVIRIKAHAAQVNCALNAVSDASSKTRLQIALNMSGPWGDAFNGALQTTSGGDFRSPAQPVKEAADLAEQAVLASGQLDESLWNIFMKCNTLKP